MKTGQAVLIGAGVLIAGSYFLKGRALGNLVFSPGSITQFSFDSTSPVIKFTMLVQNTSSVGLRIDSLAGNVFSNNQLIGNISSFLPVQIPGNSQQVIEVAVRLRILGIVNDLIRAYQYKNFQQNLQATGYANVEGIQMPINLTFTVGI